MTIKANSETLCSGTAFDGSDNHFTRVLPIFSIKKYWMLPYEEM